MSGFESARQKWNSRYRGLRLDAAPAPSHVLQRYEYLLPQQGAALDLACGTCGNGFFMAARPGLDVQAWDCSEHVIQAVQELAARVPLKLDARVRDAAGLMECASGFDVIVVSRFLDRTLCPDISQALKPGGVLYYQTFVRERVDDAGPSNPDYLLARGELLQLFSGLEVLAYHDEGLQGDTRRGIRNEALLVARRPAISQ